MHSSRSVSRFLALVTGVAMLAWAPAVAGPAVADAPAASAVRVDAIHDERGYRRVRQRLARHYDSSSDDPSLEVTDADLSGARRLVVTHKVRKGILLDKEEADRTLLHLAQLWGYRVRLIEVDEQTGRGRRPDEGCERGVELLGQPRSVPTTTRICAPFNAVGGVLGMAATVPSGQPSALATACASPWRSPL